MSDSTEVNIDPRDLRVEPYRTPRQGAYSTIPDNSVRITHVPTGITVVVESERTVFKAQAVAMKQLEAVLKAHYNNEPLQVLTLEDGVKVSGFFVASGGGGGAIQHDETALRNKIAKEIEDQIDNSNNSLFRSGLKIAAHMVRGEKGQTVKSEVDCDLYVLWVRGDSVDEQPQGKIITKEEAEVVEKLISTAGKTIFSLKKYVEVK